MSDTDKEIQKTLADLQKRAEEFQTGRNYSGNSSDFDPSSNSKLKLILTIAGVVIVLIISIIFIFKSGGTKAEIKAPPGQTIIYPKNGPPKLAPKI